MSSLENFDPYTSYRLHWLPYEITRCPNLRSSRGAQGRCTETSNIAGPSRVSSGRRSMPTEPGGAAAFATGPSITPRCKFGFHFGLRPTSFPCLLAPAQKNASGVSRRRLRDTYRCRIGAEPNSSSPIRASVCPRRFRGERVLRCQAGAPSASRSRVVDVAGGAEVALGFGRDFQPASFTLVSSKHVTRQVTGAATRGRGSRPRCPSRPG
jgi:hypothetical protein